ncbi:MAG: hypothetical protein SFY32_15715 [Bacteroidota bacterium]|nr:hypothetical protein [Bacteroidota bacterium]
MKITNQYIGFIYRSIVFSGLLSISSCATVFTGTTDIVKFETTPEKARIILDGATECISPCELSIERSISKKNIYIKKEGFESKNFELKTEFNVISILNLGNVLFWGVDALTGSIFKYEPKFYSIELEAKKP